MDPQKLPERQFTTKKTHEDSDKNQTNKDLLLSKVKALNDGLVESHLCHEKKCDQMSPIGPQGSDPRNYFIFEEEKSMMLDINDVQNTQKPYAPDESEIIESKDFLREINKSGGH